MPFKILILTKGYARYRENLVSGLAEALPDRYKVLHSTPHFGDDLWEVDWEALLKNGGRVTHLNFPKISIGTFTKAFLSRFTRQDSSQDFHQYQCRLEEVAPDMVLIQEYSTPMLKAALYCWFRGIPCMVCSDLGESTDWTQFHWRTRIIHRLAVFLTSGVIAHTRTATIPIAGKNRPMVFIPHSVDIRSLPYAPKSSIGEAIEILMVAQYIPRKGHDLLAKAVRLLVDRGVKNFTVRLVGTQDPAWVKSIIEEEKLEDFMKILGVLKGDALFAEFQNSDIFVLTSRFDTFAVVVHEAAAFGLPLLISKFAESSALMVSEGVNGFVIDPNDIGTLADRLEQLIKNPELRQQMGKESRRIGEELCASKMGAKLADWIVQYRLENHA